MESNGTFCSGSRDEDATRKSAITHHFHRLYYATLLADIGRLAINIGWQAPFSPSTCPYSTPVYFYYKVKHSRTCMAFFQCLLQSTETLSTITIQM